ncbi:MAG: hypothetical protein AB7I08_06710 [Thermoleophilia bacterium]
MGAGEHQAGGVAIRVFATTWDAIDTAGPRGRSYDAGAARAAVSIGASGTAAPVRGRDPISEPYLSVLRLRADQACPAAPADRLADGSATTWLENDGTRAFELPPLYDVVLDLARGSAAGGAYRVCAYVQQDVEGAGDEGETLVTATGDAVVAVPADRPAQPFAGVQWWARDLTTGLARRPARLVLVGPARITGVRWSAWGGARARGAGIWTYVRRRAAGRAVTRRVAVRVVLGRPVTCGGLTVYTRLGWRVTGTRLPPGVRARTTVRDSPGTRRACARVR